MKTSAFAAALVLGLAVAAAGAARAAGQPELPRNAGAAHDQGASAAQGGTRDSVKRMETKREMDVHKYEKPTGNSANSSANPSAASAQKQ
jgi:hypothetical protein